MLAISKLTTAQIVSLISEWQRDQGKESLLLTWDLLQLYFVVGMKLFRCVIDWDYWRRVKQTETAFHHPLWYKLWADRKTTTNSDRFLLSLVYSYCSLGLSSQWKTMQHPVVFPCCSKDLISSWRKRRDKAQQQAMHHGTGDRELGALIWPFVSSAAYSSEQIGSG